MVARTSFGLERAVCFALVVVSGIAIAVGSSTAQDLRPPSEWTLEEPATRAEIEMELRKFEGDSFVFAGWGGAASAAQRTVWFSVLEKDFGIKVIEDNTTSWTKLRAMVDSGHITWHVVDFDQRTVFELGSVEFQDSQAG